MTLTQLFTAIANAIRAKTGSSESIIAEDFPDEITNINTGNLSDEEYEEANDDVDDILENTTVPSGTLSITENGEYDVTNYIEADVNIASFLPNWLEIGYNYTPLNIIKDFNYAKDIYDNWDNTITNRSSAFASDKSLIIFPLVDTSNVTNTTNMFSVCENLKSVPLLDTSNVTNMANMFGQCFDIEDIPLFNTSKCINLNNFVNNDYKLTEESLDNILQMCINSKSDGYIGTKTLYGVGLRSTYYSSATIQALPHYQDFINAGWTIGY